MQFDSQRMTESREKGPRTKNRQFELELDILKHSFLNYTRLFCHLKANMEKSWKKKTGRKKGAA